MGTNTTLDDILNNIINQYATLIVNASGIEERQALKQQRNRGIINTVAGLAAKENKHLSEEAKQAFGLPIKLETEQYSTQYGNAYSGMSATQIQEAADSFFTASHVLYNIEFKQMFMLIANLAARLGEHTGSLSCHAE